MPDRAKLMDGLRCRCAYFPERDCARCHYGIQMGRRWGCDFMRMAGDAATLLKAQEPRVMTLEEVIEAARQGEPMYICEAKFPGSARWIIPINADHWGFEERGSHCQFHYYDYLSKQIGGFCCWTSRPTDERREATP